MLKSKAAIAGFCSLCCLGLSAQDCHFALRGHVTEAETNEVLAYASVLVRETGKIVSTDENGWFAIPNLCEKTSYTVEIRHIECAHFTQIVQLTENTAMEFRLLHDAVLNEVVIREKALPPPPTQAAETVAQSDLEAGKGVHLGETLKKLPGVNLLSSGATVAKPVIQGLHGNRIAIVSDGVTLQSQQWGNDHAPEIDPYASETIRVVKGADGVRYGVGAMAGAVVLEPAPLRKESGRGGWATLNGFSNGRGLAVAGSIDWRLHHNEAWAFRLQGTYKRNGNLRAPDYWLGNTGTREFDFTGMAAWEREKTQHTLSISQFNQAYGVLRASHVGNLTDLRFAIASDTPRNNLNYFSYDIERPRQEVQHNTLKYKGEIRLNEVWKWVTQYNFQYNRRQEFDRGRGSVIEGDRPQVSFRLWSNTLDAGLEHRPIRHWQGAVGVQLLQQLNYVSRGGYIPDYLSFGGSVWAIERWRRFPHPWEFEAGIRYDYRWSHATTSGNGNNNLDEVVQFGNVSGTIGAIYRILPELVLRGNTGFAWRPPHVNELFARGVHHGAGAYEQGNPDLQTEKAWNTNFSLDWQSKHGHAGLSLFRNAVQDFIYLNQPRDSVVLTVRGPFPAYFHQQADAVLQGMDLNVSLRTLGRVYVEARASTLFALRKTKDSDGKNRDWLPLMPGDRYQYGLRWLIQDHSAPTFIRLLATTAIRQWRIPAEGLTKAAPETFTVLGLEAAHSFRWGKRRIEAGLNVQNLGNRRYREYLDLFRFYADMPGVNVALRVKAVF